jgi:hypothetical protein
MADLCGALHCNLMMPFKKPKGKCNAAAATRNRHLCEALIIFLVSDINLFGWLVLCYFDNVQDTYLILITYLSVDHRTYLVLGIQCFNADFSSRDRASTPATPIFILLASEVSVLQDDTTPVR